MPTVQFKYGDYNVENLQKVISQGGQRVEDTYILPNGSICYFKEDSQVSPTEILTEGQVREIAEKVFEKSVQKRAEEGFEKIDSKTPLIYDLEKRIREINGDVTIPFEKLERLVNEYGYEEAMHFLQQMYPNGIKFTIYSDESMRAWERMREMEEQHRIDIDKLSVEFRNKKELEVRD